MHPILVLIYWILEIIWFLVIAQVILSWLIAFNIINTYQPIVQTISSFLHRITEPLYRPLRQVVPIYNGIDFVPLVVLLLVGITQYSMVYYFAGY